MIDWFELAYFSDGGTTFGGTGRRETEGEMIYTRTAKAQSKMNKNESLGCRVATRKREKMHSESLTAVYVSMYLFYSVPVRCHVRAVIICLGSARPPWQYAPPNALAGG